MKAAYLKAAFMRSADSLTPNKISNILPHSSPLWMSFALPSLDFQRRPDAMPSMAHPALGATRSVRHIQRRR